MKLDEARTPEQYDLAMADAIAGRMYNENASSLSNEEIERTLSGCVAPSILIPAAKRLRDSGQLTIDKILPDLFTKTI